MKIKTAGTFILMCCLLITSAKATETRTASFAGASDYIWDNSQVFLYPSIAPLYYRSLVAELGDNGSEVEANSSVYLLYANEEQSFGVVGLAVNRRSAGYSSLCDYLTPVRTDLYSVDIITRLQDRNLGRNLEQIEAPRASYNLVYSKKFGNITGGVILGRTSWSVLDNSSGGEKKANSGLFELGLGAGYEAKESLRADAAISYSSFGFGSSYSFAGQDSNQEFKSDGSRSLNFNGRIFYALNEDVVIVPLLRLDYSQFGYLYSQDSDSLNCSGKVEQIGFTLGCGWNYQFRSHLKLIAGTDMNYMKSSIQDSLIIGSPGENKEIRTELVFPSIHLGMEVNLTNWFTVRLGATQKALSAQRTVDYFDGTSSRTESSGQPYQLDMGLTLRTGNLSMDLLVNPELLYSGGNLASGSKTWPANSVAVSYRF